MTNDTQNKLIDSDDPNQGKPMPIWMVKLIKRHNIKNMELQKRRAKNRIRNKQARKSRRLNRILS